MSARLTQEQKCGIAAKEMERIEHELVNFRVKSWRQTSQGAAEIDEKLLRIDELETRKGQLTKGLANAKSFGSSRGQRSHSGKVNYDSQKLAEVFKQESNGQKRQLEKLRTRNGVLRSQITRLRGRVRQDTATAAETGPVDMQQLQLENASSFQELCGCNREVTLLREKAVAANKNRNSYQLKLAKQVSTCEKLKTDMQKLTDKMTALEQEMPMTCEQLKKQERRKRRLQRLAEEYSHMTPTVDDFFRLKILEEQAKAKERTEIRQRYLSDLTKRTKKRAKSAQGRIQTMNSTPESDGGKIVRRRTFNIEFRPV